MILGALVEGRYGHDTHGKMEMNMGFRGRAYIKIMGTMPGRNKRGLRRGGSFPRR